MAYPGPGTLPELLTHLSCVRMYLCVYGFVTHKCVHTYGHLGSRGRNTALTLQTQAQSSAPVVTVRPPNSPTGDSVLAELMPSLAVPLPFPCQPSIPDFRGDTLGLQALGQPARPQGKSAALLSCLTAQRSWRQPVWVGQLIFLVAQSPGKSQPHQGTTRQAGWSPKDGADSFIATRRSHGASPATLPCSAVPRPGTG